MRASPNTQFVSTGSSVDQLLAEDSDLRDRTIAIELGKGEREQIEVEGIDLEAIYLSHGVAGLLNLGFIITVDGAKLFHTGDLSPDAVHVSYLQDYGLPEEQIDVAFVPDFWLIMEEYHAHVLEGIQPRYVMPMHYPYEDPPQGIEDDFPNAFVFTDTMENWILP
jgi:L-ascorbate metabolism protein UlaG (beta-lactamase superfamily)